ncbi:calcium-binding protein [Pelagibius marinus]|uniref:calcium-binding protein n=1 Tax=Pelagibius marinus TaxID=2762760 RepID=UPI00187315BD|nr:hypothetical protein [Pelagibius marinus]
MQPSAQPELTDEQIMLVLEVLAGGAEPSSATAPAPVPQYDDVLPPLAQQDHADEQFMPALKLLEGAEEQPLITEAAPAPSGGGASSYGADFGALITAGLQPTAGIADTMVPKTLFATLGLGEADAILLAGDARTSVIAATVLPAVDSGSDDGGAGGGGRPADDGFPGGRSAFDNNGFFAGNSFFSSSQVGTGGNKNAENEGDGTEDGDGAGGGDEAGSGAEALFTQQADSVDFNDLSSGDYVAASQYNALNGNDFVILPDGAAAASASGFSPGTQFEAGNGNDTVLGGGLADRIDGGNGKDEIHGGGGDDTLSGGNGKDCFVFSLASDEGDDVILDFATGKGGDTLRISDLTDLNGDEAIDIDDLDAGAGTVAGTAASVVIAFASGGVVTLDGLDGTGVNSFADLLDMKVTIDIA